MDRRRFIETSACAGLVLSSGITSYGQSPKKIVTRTIPSSGEALPCIGLGTYRSFDVGGNEQAREPLKQVLNTLMDFGGSVIDSSPMYARSEKVIGELSGEMGLNEKLFGATKVWTTGKQAGIDQMNRSMDLMGIRPMDLMQVHNLQDWETHLKTLFQWKEEGKVRYVGITHYVESAYPKMERIMKEHPLDFIQLNYSIVTRKAEESILPLAMDRGIAVLVNRPYEGGALFSSVRGKELPAWSRDLGVESWGQLFLKYILGNPAVTCIIPATAKPHHMKDNMGAGLGRMPNENELKKMIALV